jgi:hypothetical protein
VLAKRRGRNHDADGDGQDDRYDAPAKQAAVVENLND